MAHDKFVMSARQAAELDHAFARNGWTPEDVKKLSTGTMLSEIRGLVRGLAEISKIPHIIDLDANPRIFNGVTVEEHRKGGLFTWDAKKVHLYLATNQNGGKDCDGNRLRKELKGKNPFNANLLDHLLKNPSLIPEEWKDVHVFFWGTIYRGKVFCDTYGSSVRYLCWDGIRWDWGMRPLHRNFHSQLPAALHIS